MSTKTIKRPKNQARLVITFHIVYPEESCSYSVDAVDLLRKADINHHLLQELDSMIRVECDQEFDIQDYTVEVTK